MARKTGIIAVLLLIISALLCCAAFAQEQQPPPTGEEEMPPVTPYGEEQPPTGEEQAAPGSIYLYLNDELAAVEREIMGGNQMVEFAVLELLTGPTEEEKAAGYITYIPEGVKLQYTTIKQDRSEFSINLSRELLSLSGDVESSTRALAQIVKTIREVSGIESVGITVAGEAMGDTPQDAFEALGVSREDVDRELGVPIPSSDGNGGNTGLILAIVFGVLGAAVLIFLVIYYLNRRGKKQGPPDKEKKAKSKAGKKTRK